MTERLGQTAFILLLTDRYVGLIQLLYDSAHVPMRDTAEIEGNYLMVNVFIFCILHIIGLQNK